MRLFNYILLLGCLLGLTKEVYADGCSRNHDVPTTVAQINFGRIVVPPDLPVNSIIASKSWTFPASKSPAAKGCTGTYYFYADIVGDRKHLGNKVYETNIPGIGIKMYRAGSAAPNYSKTTTTKPVDVYFQIMLKVELIKTSAVTGTGPLEAGTLLEYHIRTDPDPIATIVATSNSAYVVSPSCQITSGENMNKYLHVANINDLKKIGDTTIHDNFDIALQCGGIVDATGYSNVRIMFNGDKPPSFDDKSGVLVNKYISNTGAKGVGIQILKNDKPLEFNKEYLLGKMDKNKSYYYTVPLTARYYQYENKATTGSVESHMVFNLTYD